MKKKSIFFYFKSVRDSLTALYANDAKKKKRDPRRLLSTSAPATVNNNLLGNFEESVLNGRLEPVSTVEGFTAEIGASGSFHPRHLTLPVTVFFYTLCENSNIASPYLVSLVVVCACSNCFKLETRRGRVYCICLCV